MENIQSSPTTIVTLWGYLQFNIKLPQGLRILLLFRLGQRSWENEQLVARFLSQFPSPASLNEALLLWHVRAGREPGILGFNLRDTLVKSSLSYTGHLLQDQSYWDNQLSLCLSNKCWGKKNLLMSNKRYLHMDSQLIFSLQKASSPACRHGNRDNPSSDLHCWTSELSNTFAQLCCVPE